ncbi:MULTISPECIES: sugar ABC transporter ATP-binding protein [Inquilinus]|uniref:Ribose transport system ATP-binding protein n=1 Tax=Inquilinus ginsengisoli TaxID=363840 RepID=A0ABU1JKN3_9PROT|nr:sugar ABC transporter ATP-binding protein [Inquilinus ginsengisoli]MDR6288882.1 ribose transport system ATP-binding protein [Inquilinus ginsengisoli]
MLQAVGIQKSFGSVQALKGVDVEIRPNEVVGLVGENGAGKSTLMRILAGVQQPTSGELRRDGEVLHLGDPRQANARGIVMVFQEQSLLLNLSVAENIFLGQEQEFIRFGLVNWKRLNAAARRQLEKVGLDIDPATRAQDLSFAARQMVELAKALALEDRVEGDLVILLDEPTSVLEQAEIDLLFDRVRTLKSRASFVFVSHRLDEVLEISDRIYVMKDGGVVAEMPVADADTPTLHRIMVGREVHAEYYRESEQHPAQSEIVLQAKGLCCEGRYRDIDLTLHRGEVLGIAGVIGSGREDLVRSFFGFVQPTAGTLEVAGKAVRFRSPADAVEHGIGFIPSERRVEGLVMMLSVATNMTLARLEAAEGPIGLSRRRERSLAEDWTKRLAIRAAGPDAACLSLSGGNQQKVVLAKWLTAESRILILDHPTRGIDVGAKEEVFRLIRALCRDGVSVILIADTLEETIGLSHTVLAMRDGTITARMGAAPGRKPAQVDLIGHMV